MDGTVTSIKLPDFTRWQWASQTERQWWRPLFTEVAQAFHTLERLSVLHGVRRAAWLIVSPAELVTLTQWAHQHELLVIPTATTEGVEAPYSTTAAKDGHYLRVILTTPEHYRDILPWKTDDHI
jgi:hypothetical protein